MVVTWFEGGCKCTGDVGARGVRCQVRARAMRRRPRWANQPGWRPLATRRRSANQSGCNCPRSRFRFVLDRPLNAQSHPSSRGQRVQTVPCLTRIRRMRQWRNGLHLKLQLLWSSKNSLDKKANYLTNWQKLKALHPTSTHPTLAYAGGSRSDGVLRIFR